MMESIPVFDKKIREMEPQTPSKKENMEMWYPSLTNYIVGSQQLSLGDLVGTEGLEQRSGVQSRLG